MLTNRTSGTMDSVPQPDRMEDKRQHLTSMLMRESLLDKDMQRSTEVPVFRMSPDTHVIRLTGGLRFIPSSQWLDHRAAGRRARQPNGKLPWRPEKTILLAIPSSHSPASSAALRFHLPRRFRRCVPKLPYNPAKKAQKNFVPSKAICLSACVTDTTPPSNGGSRRSN